MKTRDWQHNKDMWIKILERQTGEGLDTWRRRLRERSFRDERELKTWLAQQNVTGYAQQLLVLEHFGYPDFLRSSGDALIERQYEDSPELRGIYDRSSRRQPAVVTSRFKRGRPTCPS